MNYKTSSNSLREQNIGIRESRSVDLNFVMYSIIVTLNLERINDSSCLIYSYSCSLNYNTKYL